jgi:hypothetical protein
MAEKIACIPRSFTRSGKHFDPPTHKATEGQGKFNVPLSKVDRDKSREALAKWGTLTRHTSETKSEDLVETAKDRSLNRATNSR